MMRRGANWCKPVKVRMVTSSYEGKDCNLSIETTSYEEERESEKKRQSRRKIKQIGHDNIYALNTKALAIGQKTTLQ